MLVDAGALGDLVEPVPTAAAQGELGGEQGEAVLGGGGGQLLRGGALAGELVEQLDADPALGLREAVEQRRVLPTARVAGIRIEAGPGVLAQQ